MNDNGLSYIDLFAGAGGLSEGFIQSGYRPIAHVEMNEYAAKTIETRIAYYYLKENGNLDSYYQFLISDNMTYEPGAEKVRKGLESVDIFVKSYSDLLAEARRYNDDLYRMYENISSKKNEKVGE